MTLHWLHATRHPRTPPIWLELPAKDALDLDTVAVNGSQSGEMHLDVKNWTELRGACVDRLAGEFGIYPLTRSVCRLDLRPTRTDPQPAARRPEPGAPSPA